MQDPLATGVLLMNLVALVSLGAVALTQDTEHDAAPSLRGASDDDVVVVTGEGSPDRLVAASLGDAVLTVSRPRDVGSLVDHVRALVPTRVVVLGGRDVVSTGVASALSAATTAPVTRLAGPDRYTTAARAALASAVPPVQQVHVAPSDVPPTAAGEQGNAASGVPLLLVTRDRVPAATVAALRRLRPDALTVVGGAGAVSDAVVQQLRRDTGAEVERRTDD